MIIPSFDSYKRVPVSPAALRLLCDFATGDPALTLHRLEVDWGEVFTGALRHGLIGLVNNYLEKNASVDFPPAEFRTSVKKAYEVSALRMALIYRGVANILEFLNRSGIPFMVVKGPAIGTTVYPEPYLRGFNDLDILVRESDWSAMDKLLDQNGFRLELGSQDPPPHLISQDVKQENLYINEQIHLVIEVHYDDILNAGLATRDVEGFWRRFITIDICGIPCRTLSIEDQLVYLCAHLHHHGYSRLIWFSDLVLILEKNAGQINWQNFIGIVKNEEAQVPVYYSLLFLMKLMGENIPQMVLKAIQPDNFRRHMHDLIWPQGKVLSFDRLPEIHFSFYFIPLYHRLLPDLLVMGRRSEKVSYLLHLIFPSRAWLRNHYHLKDSAWASLYHLLHPFRLLSVYLGETINVIFCRREMA